MIVFKICFISSGKMPEANYKFEIIDNGFAMNVMILFTN